MQIEAAYLNYNLSISYRNSDLLLLYSDVFQLFYIC